MNISSRFTIAVHILTLVHLMEDDPVHIVTSDFIAGSVHTNPVVIRRIIGALKRAGFLRVQAGVGGAFLLVDPAKVTLYEIYRAVDVVQERKLFKFHQHPNGRCPVGANIEEILGSVLDDAQRAMEHALQNVTLDEIIEKIRDKMGR